MDIVHHAHTQHSTDICIEPGSIVSYITDIGTEEKAVDTKEKEDSMHNKIITADEAEPGNIVVWTGDVLPPDEATRGMFVETINSNLIKVQWDNEEICTARINEILILDVQHPEYIEEQKWHKVMVYMEVRRDIVNKEHAVCRFRTGETDVEEMYTDLRRLELAIVGGGGVPNN